MGMQKRYLALLKAHISLRLLRELSTLFFYRLVDQINTQIFLRALVTQTMQANDPSVVQDYLQKHLCRLRTSTKGFFVFKGLNTNSFVLLLTPNPGPRICYVMRGSEICCSNLFRLVVF